MIREIFDHVGQDKNTLCTARELNKTARAAGFAPMWNEIRLEQLMSFAVSKKLDERERAHPPGNGRIGGR